MYGRKKVCKWTLLRCQCCLQGIIRDGHILQNLQVLREHLFHLWGTRGTREVKKGPEDQEEDNVNVRWEVSDRPYKEDAAVGGNL